MKFTAKTGSQRGKRALSVFFQGILLILTVALKAHAIDSIAVQTEKTSTGQLAFHYSLPSNGFITLVIDDSRGHRIRNLIAAAPRKAGPNTELWDRTDEQGQPVAASQCRWRILFHTGIDAEFVMSYGNPGTPPWAMADGTGGWGADHTKPQAAVNTPEGMVLGWPTAESGWFLIGVGPDGHKKWGLKNHYTFGDTLINLASDGQYIYVASEQNAAPLLKYYKKTAHGVLYRYRIADRKLAKIGGADEIVITNRMDGNVRGIAVAGDTAYVALLKENRIAAVSVTQGALSPEKDISVHAPSALAVDKSGGLVVASGRQVVRVDLNTKHTQPLVSEGLDDPVGLSIDPSGKIYVSDRGKSQQVKVFMPDGKPLRTIGIAGGRPPRGLHQSSGMYQPLGLAVDAQGLLWVMEEDDKPKRISVWNAATGMFVREYIGPPHYGATDGSVAEFDKTMAFAEGAQYRLDWEKKAFTFVATPGRAINDEDVFGRAAVRKIFRSKARVLTASDAHVQVIGELANGSLRPLAAVGEIDDLTRRLGMYTGAIERKVEQLKAAGSRVDAKGNPVPATAFIWTDKNGDGIAQDSEFTWKSNLHWGGYWGTGVGDDLTIYMQSSGQVYQLPVIGWNIHGAPLYSFESATTIPYTGSAEHVAASPDGVLIVNAKPQLQGIKLSGEQQWTYPNPWEGVQGSHSADFPAPGRLIGPLSITGFAPVGGQVGTLFAMNGNLGQQFLMTTDGLWVGTLLRDWRLAKVEDMYTVPDEDFGGYFWRDQASGEVYLEAGKSEYRLYRIKGLETIRRSEGELTFNNQAAAGNRNLTAQPASALNIPSVSIPHLDVPFNISGRMEDLPKAMHFVPVEADANSKFRFALAHDNQDLYLVYDVTDDTPFQNPGQDWQGMFSTGDCVDLMIGANQNADPKRKDGASGDERLLFTVRDGKPLAVLYKQVDPTRHAPVVFTSPTRAITFDSVTELPEAHISVSRSSTGYVIMASVPLASLGLTKESSSLTGDVGVIFGSESGNGARLRLYWANKSTGITSDVPSEATLSPDHWGRLQLQ